MTRVYVSRALLALSLVLQAGLVLGQSGEPVLFGGEQVPPPNQRIQVQREGALTVRSAVPSAQEAIDIFGSNLYTRNVQPVWIEVRNESASPLFLTPMGLDSGYYSPRESAHRSGAPRPLSILNREFEQRSVRRLAVEPGSIQSGYIFTRVDEGTKSFNVDVMGDERPYTFTFFIPVPGLRIDHREVVFSELYDASERRDLQLPELISALEKMPCCVADSANRDKGDPLNLVLIGQPLHIYHAFLRAGWDETETINRSSLWRTALSAMTGGAYRYSPVSALYVFDRPQDIALQRARGSIHLRNHLRLWLTPLTLNGTPVWIGQISRDIGVRFTWRTITTHKIDPDVDETRDFLLEDLAYAEAVKAYGFIGGVGEASYDQPRGNLTGDPYFTDGRRLVMLITDEPTSIAELKPFRLKR